MIGVVIADDSATFRRYLRRTLEAEGDIRVLAEVEDSARAVEATLAARPAVLVLDLVMPRSGLDALRTLMATAPLPVVVVSSTVQPGDRRAAVEALSLGAVEVLPKPRTLTDSDVQGHALRRVVRAAAGVTFARRRPSPPDAPRVRPPGRGERVRAVGLVASTGGPAALARVLGEMPVETAVPILVVQHIGADFEADFVRWLDSLTTRTVKLAEENEVLSPHTVYVGPAGRHLAARDGRVLLVDGPAVAGFAPSGTVLFRSLAKEFGRGAAGFLLTGMGDDGADGLLDLRLAGGHTGAQSAPSCVVYGMPRAAVERGAAAATYALEEIPAVISALAAPVEGRS